MTTKTIFKIILILGTSILPSYAEDLDLDGVPDSIDKCPDTPFTNTVDADGCTVSVLLLPDEKATDTTIAELYYRYTHDEESPNETGNIYTLQLSYYRNDWRFSLKSGMYRFDGKSGSLDTTLKIRKRFRPIRGLRLYPGLSLKLPTYDFEGNKMDIKASISASYSLRHDTTLFGGYSYTLVGDETNTRPLHNTHAGYFGAGYFFSDNVYADISFDASQSKYRDTSTHRSITTSLFYQFSPRLYLTAELTHEFDIPENVAFGISIGYRLW